MADAVATQILVDGPKTAVMKFTSISDGTGESAVTKVDVSALSGSPSEVRITQIWCDTLGVAVDILWDATTDVLAHTITSDMNGHWDYRCFNTLQNDSGVGKTGNIKFTTTGASANDRYTIVLELSKVYGTAVGGQEPVPESWTPADLGASLALWLDADDASTITLNGSNVSQWDDKSGNGNHVLNGTASTQPAYLTTGWNGKPTVSFTKTGLEFLFKAGVSNFAANNDYTLASAFEYFQTNNNWDMVAGWRSVPNVAAVPNGGTPVLQFMSASDIQIGVHNTDVTATNINVAVTSRLGKKIATVGRSGGTNGDGGAVTVTSTGFSQPTYQTNGTQTWVSAAATGFQVGGRQQNGTAYGDKYISEVVGCNTKLSTEDRQKLEGYLAWKWGGI